MKTESKTETRIVSHLQAHPLSDAIFGPMGDDEFQELKQDIDERGVNHPLELDPEGRVICGSQRR
jgi:ParB-like chromosome segregation protein Spo0J